jgi:hypothetical protein
MRCTHGLFIGVSRSRGCNTLLLLFKKWRIFLCGISWHMRGEKTRREKAEKKKLNAASRSSNQRVQQSKILLLLLCIQIETCCSDNRTGNSSRQVAIFFFYFGICRVIIQPFFFIIKKKFVNSFFYFYLIIGRFRVLFGLFKFKRNRQQELNGIWIFYFGNNRQNEFPCFSPKQRKQLRNKSKSSKRIKV